MIYIVPRERHAELSSLAAQLKDQTMALAVIDGTRPGVVVANDKDHPSAFFVAAPEGEFAWTYLAGRPDDADFHQDLNRWIFDDRGLGEEAAFSFLVCDSDSWKPGLVSILQPRSVISDRRLHFSICRRPSAWKDSVPDGYCIVPINRRLVASGIEIPETLSSWFNHNFGSQEAFLERGIGSVAIYEDRIVAWSLSDSVINRRTDIGVETDEAHRRKGLAYCTVCQTVELALDRGLDEIGWHCHVINQGSIRTAEKAGFQLQYEYPIYAIHVDVEKHAHLARVIGDEIIGQATGALRINDHQEAHRLFERALGFSTHAEFGVYVLAARAAAGAEMADAAFAWLTRASELGWTPSPDRHGYPEFYSLRSDPRWSRLST